MYLTEGYTARPLGPEDYDLVYGWFSQDDFYLDTPDPARETEARVRELITFPGSHLLLVEDAEGRPCALVDVVFRHAYRVAELEVGFGPALSDPGERQAVFDAATRLLFAETHVLRVQKYVYEFDEAGRARCEVAGYRLEARLRRQVFRLGRWWDVLVYGQLRGETVWAGVAAGGAPAEGSTSAGAAADAAAGAGGVP